MASSEPDVDFNLQQVLKSIEVNEIKNRQVEQELIAEKSKNEELKKEREIVLAKCEKENFKTSQFEKEISLLDEKIPRKNATIEKLTKQIEDIHIQTEDVRWKQTKAKLVLESERARRQTYRQAMDKRTAEDAEKTKSELEGEIGCKIAAAKTERALMKKELIKRKEFKQKEISKLENALKEKEKSLLDIDSEVSVLRKRNAAMLLRLKCKLQQSEARRRGLATSREECREMAARARLLK